MNLNEDKFLFKLQQNSNKQLTNNKENVYEEISRRPRFDIFPKSVNNKQIHLLSF